MVDTEEREPPSGYITRRRRDLGAFWFEAP
jgi:hypothetical protein